MSTLLLSEIFPPQTGGTARWFWEIYRRLPREEFRVVSHCFPGYEQFDRTHDLSIERLQLSLPEWGVKSIRGLRDYFRVARKVSRLARDSGIDEVHAARCLPEGWIARLLNLYCGIRYVVYVHGEDIETAATSREHRWMVQQVFKKADYLIANSNSTCDILLDRWNLSGDKVHVLYPGVDSRRFLPADQDDDIRNELGWLNRSVILTVGRLQERKGHAQLIRALPQVLEAIPNALYSIVGNGDQREKLEQLVSDYNLQSAVQFLGEIDDSQLVKCYQQCDLFILPNRRIDHDIEGFGIVLLEAQACGKPVIAGESGGTRETMQIPKTGRIVCCEDVEVVAQTVTDLLKDRDLCRTMGNAGRRWIVENFDWENLSQNALSPAWLVRHNQRDSNYH